MLERLALAAFLQAALIGPVFAVDCKSDNLAQSELNDCSEQGFKQADALLNARYQKIVGCLKEQARPLVEAQRAWIKFRDAECKFQGAATEGGSIQPLIIAGCLRGVTEERAKGLDYYLTCQEGDLSCPTVSCDFPKGATSK